MSRQFVDTKLMGHSPTRLPEEISRDLFDALESGDQFRWSNVDLNNACHKSQLPYPKAYIPFAETEDGYDWFWGQAFVLSGEVMVILLVPWKKDDENKDGTNSDRLANIYIIGRPIEYAEFRGLTERLITCFRDYKDKHSRPIVQRPDLGAIPL